MIDGESRMGPTVFLTPGDARTARAAGVAFARSIAGAPSAWLTLALGEQSLIIREAIERCGCPAQTADGEGRAVPRPPDSA